MHEIIKQRIKYLVEFGAVPSEERIRPVLLLLVVLNLVQTIAVLVRLFTVL